VAVDGQPGPFFATLPGYSYPRFGGGVTIFALTLPKLKMR
jgi:hypothetical protein